MYVINKHLFGSSAGPEYFDTGNLIKVKINPGNSKYIALINFWPVTINWKVTSWEKRWQAQIRHAKPRCVTQFL